MKVEVMDAICGSGKTVGIIKWMIENPNKRYLYISPMLTEVEERIPEECSALEFVFPSDERSTKSEHLLELLKEHRNISFTHSLFSSLTLEHLRLIKELGYTLIVDEEFGLIEPYSGKYKKGDIVSLEKQNLIKVDEDNLGRVEWLWDDMDNNTQYTELQRLCSTDMLYCSKRDRDMMVIQLPMALVGSAERTIILTYLFSGSVMESFLKLKGVDVLPFTEVELLKDTEEVLARSRELITICNTTSTNSIKSLSLSSSWYSNNANTKELNRVSNAIRSVIRKHGNEVILLTAPKDSVERFKGNTKTKNARCVSPRNMIIDEVFLYCGARATNDYAHKSVAIHAYNRFTNLVVKSYLQDYGKDINAVPDDDKFALAEMIQWIWRTQIREDKPIELYILSGRMEKIFKAWLDGK